MKKIISLLLILFAMNMLFAEPASVGLTDSDVSNFARNFNSIQKELNSASSDEDIIAILNKNGISGKNNVEKYQTIILGTTIVNVEANMDSDTIAMYKKLGVDPLQSYTSQINSNDLSVIRKYSKQLVSSVYGMEIEDDDAFEKINSKKKNNQSLINGAEREKLLRQQQEAYKQQELEQEMLNESKKKKPFEGSKYLSNVEKKIKDSKKTSDCGFLYKKYDSKNASYYKKKTGKVPSFSAHKAWYTTSSKTEQEALFSISSSEITLKYINDNGEEIDKNIKLTLTSSELYVAKKTGKEKFYDKGVGGEIILKTKEAGTIRIWYSEGQYSGNQKVKVWIEALGEVDFDEFVYYLG